MKKKFIILVAIGCLLLPLAAVHAQQGIQKAGSLLNTAVGPGQTGLSGSLPNLTSTVITALLSLLGTIFFGLTIYAGILWMTAAGQEDKVTKATNILQAAVIGLIIVLAAYAITAFVTSNLGGGGGGTTATTCKSAGGTGCVQVCNPPSDTVVPGTFSDCGSDAPICCK